MRETVLVTCDVFLRCSFRRCSLCFVLLLGELNRDFLERDVQSESVNDVQFLFIFDTVCDVYGLICESCPAASNPTASTFLYL